MSHTATPSEVFHQLVDGVAKLVAGDASQVDRLAALYAEQTYVTHPMAPPGIEPLLTRDDLRHHFARGLDRMPQEPVLQDYRAADVIIHETADPEVIVAEFAYRGTSAGTPFAVPCVFVLRVRDGEIVESRDYIDHQRSARARGRTA